MILCRIIQQVNAKCLMLEWRLFFFIFLIISPGPFGLSLQLQENLVFVELTRFLCQFMTVLWEYFRSTVRKQYSMPYEEIWMLKKYCQTWGNFNSSSHDSITNPLIPTFLLQEYCWSCAGRRAWTLWGNPKKGPWERERRRERIYVCKIATLLNINNYAFLEATLQFFLFLLFIYFFFFCFPPGIDFYRK